MLAIRLPMHRSSCRRASRASDRLGDGGERDTEDEGVIYYTPDGDGYVLYARSWSGGAAASAAAADPARR